MGAKIITVSGYKGGVSKSTTALHLAAWLSERGKVLLIDGDVNRTLLNWSRRGNGALGFDVVDERRAMKHAAGRDFLIIDTPARPDSEDLREIAAGADLLILPTSPDVVSLEPMIEIAKDLGKAPYRALIAIVPPAPSKEGETMQADLQMNKVPVFKTLIWRRAGYQRAALIGRTIRDVEDHRARQGWTDYESLGAEILELI
ncbi:MAG: ParA family protein [Blastocatellia bacterium]|nr:ParA family protein [Blastocatellia bacterium]